MNSKIFLFSLFFIALNFSIKAQTYSNVKINFNDDRVLKVNEIFVDKSKEKTILETKDLVVNKQIQDLYKINFIEYKKGNNFLPFLIGGFLGSTLVAVATSENGYYSAGPKIVIGTLATSIIGLLIPKYRKIEL